MKIGKPFVSVGINYRLGYHGFLGSKDLEEEARQNGEVYSPNRGLWDQRIALLWVSLRRKYTVLRHLMTVMINMLLKREL